MAKKKLFLCFHSELKEAPQYRAFVQRVAYYLRIQEELDVFCYDKGWNTETWELYVTPFVQAADIFVIFVGDKAGDGQAKELRAFCTTHPTEGSLFIACFDSVIPESIRDVFRETGAKAKPIPLEKTKNDPDFLKTARDCAVNICKSCTTSRLFWDDGLPVGYPFDYEKTIIDHYLVGSEAYASNPNAGSLLMDGCPLTWPQLEDPALSPQYYSSPLGEDEVGERREDKYVVVDPRGLDLKAANAEETFLRKSHLSFLEAGPRKRLVMPKQDENVLTIGIAVSGGIAPGINSVIEGIVERHISYFKASKANVGAQASDEGSYERSPYDLVIILFENGLSGIAESEKDGKAKVKKTVFSTKEDRSFGEEIDVLERQVRDVAAKGGSQVETFRYDELLPNKGDRNANLDCLVKRLSDRKIDILYVIGGEGSMRAAHALQTRARHLKANRDIMKMPHIVGIPKTMDNDILWVWQSFGFLSAVEKAREFIVNLHTEVSANPRLCVIQLFGSDSGFVVSHAALGAGAACCGALIPEVNFSLVRLGDYICEYLGKEGSDRHGGLVLAETAVPVDVEDHLDDPSLDVDLNERTAVRMFMGSALLTKHDIVGKGRVKLLADIEKPPLGEDEIAVLRRFFAPSILSLMKWIVQHGDETEIVDNCWPMLLNSVNELVKDKAVWLSLRDFVKGNRADPIRQKGKALFGTLEKLDQSDPVELWNSKDFADALHDLTELMGLPYEALLIYRLIDPSSKRKHTISDIGKKYLLGQLSRRLTETLNRTILETLFPQLFVRKLSSSQCERRVFGQTPDELRMAGLKIVSNYLQNRIRTMGDQGDPKDPWRHYRVLINQPRHLIRSMDPSCHDVIFCGRLGKLAVDNAMGGYSGFMISQWLTEYVLVPLDLVVLGRKRVPPYGIFWKSVIASTEQPANLWWPEPPKVERAGGDSSSSKQAHP